MVSAVRGSAATRAHGQQQVGRRVLRSLDPSEEATLTTDPGLLVEVREDCYFGQPGSKPDAPKPPCPTEQERALLAQVTAHVRQSFDYTSVPYAPLQALGEQRKKRASSTKARQCLERPAAGQGSVLFSQGPGARIERNAAGYDVLVLPAGASFFKGTRYFHSDIGGLPYVWVGKPLVAVMYAERYSGGVLVYQAARQLRLFVLNHNNLRRMHETTQWDKLDPGLRSAFQLKTGMGIPLAEQARRVREYNRLLPDEPLVMHRTRRLWRFTYCTEPVRTRVFGAITNDRAVAQAFLELKAQLGDVDGWYSPESYTPFHCALSEEVMLFLGGEGVRLAPEHPLFWKHWVDKLPLGPGGLPDAPFDMHPAYYGANRGLCLLQSLAEQRAASGQRAAAPPAMMLSWNVWGLRAPNALLTPEQVCDACVALLTSGPLPGVIALQGVPEHMLPRMRDMLRAGAGLELLASVPNGPVIDTPEGARPQVLAVLASPAALGAGARARVATQRASSLPQAAGPRGAVLVELPTPPPAPQGAPSPLQILVVGVSDATPYVRESSQVLQMPAFLQVHRSNVQDRCGHLRAWLDEFPGALLVAGSFGSGPDGEEVAMLTEHAGFSRVPLVRGTSTTLLPKQPAADHVLVRASPGTCPGLVTRTVPSVLSMHLPMELAWEKQ